MSPEPETGFFRAESPGEVLALLARLGPRARLLAGGTDLMVRINRRQFKPQALIYIGRCGLDYIEDRGGDLAIGAAAPLADVLASPLVARLAPLLREAVSHMASPAVRSLASLGGNLANASPAADSAVPLLALEARLNLASARGVRTVALEEFFTGPGRTVLAADEMIQEVTVPAGAGARPWAYRKIGRRQAHTLSIISAAAAAEAADGRCHSVRLALGAVGPTPILAREAASILIGQPPRAELIAGAAEAAGQEISPIDDVRASAWYRRRACRALSARLLNQVLRPGREES